jgi:hypothetical protein
MVSLRELTSFPNPVDEVSARLVAAGVVLLCSALLVTDSHWLLPVLTYGVLARVLTGPSLSPLGQLVTRVLTPALGSPARPVPGPPKRFAQGVGLVFTVSACVLGYGFGQWGAAELLVAIVAGFAVLESVFAFCMGCKVFSVLMRIGVIPDEVCAACADLSLRPRVPAA